MLNGLFLLNSAAAVAKDPYFPYVTLLLPGNGSNGAQNNTFLDSSTNNFTITRNGNTTQGSFSPYATNWSNYFDGSGDYLSVASNAAFDLGSSDFTVECWFNSSSFAAGFGLISRYNYSGVGLGWVLSIVNSTTVRFVRGNDVILDCTVSTMSTGTWYHVAAVRNGSTLTVYLNGTQVGQATGISNFSDAATALQIGRTNTTTNDINGYISNARVVKGTAVYTAAFTPPTAPLTAISGTSLLTCQSNRFIDNSSNAFAITVNGDTKVSRFSPFSPASAYSTTANGGSAYFDGSGDYLSGASWSSAGNFGTGDFTVECWVYATAAPQSNQVIWSCNIYPNSTGLILQYAGSGATQLNVGSATGAVISASAGWSFNQWHHIAVVRSGTTLTLYIDGVSRGSATFSNNCTDGLQYIGRPNDVANYMMQGYISNLRIVKGTAVYTAAFTPPTAPVTAISGTSLLLNATNAAIFDNAMINDLETVGNAQVSTAQSKFGGSSMYFDGTGDWLTVRDNPALQFGTGNFTVEFWAYVSSSSGYRGVIGKGSSTTGWAVFIDTGGNWAFTNATTNTIGSVAAAFNTWTHVAFVRSGTTATLYINGTSAGSATVSTNFNQTDQLVVGAGRDLTIPYTGYLDDVRLTAGVARYTANFTPPTAAFPVQ